MLWFDKLSLWNKCVAAVIGFSFIYMIMESGDATQQNINAHQVQVTDTSNPHAPEIQASQEREHQTIETTTAMSEEQHAGFHCLSKFNGSHRDVVRQVKEKLNDPSSFKHIETSITPVNDKGLHALYMDYSATNTLGGTSRQTANAVISNEDCSAILVSIQ